MSNQVPIKKSSRHGGKRPGAGRKPGAPSKRTEAMNAAIVARIEGSDGKLDPVEAMMDIAEWAVRQWRAASQSGEAASALHFGEQAMDWLAKAAPYIRPRLSAVEAKVNVSISVYERIERGRQRLSLAA